MTHTDLDGDSSGLGELQQMVAQLLHPAGEQLGVADLSLEALHQIYDLRPGTGHIHKVLLGRLLKGSLANKPYVPKM